MTITNGQCNMMTKVKWSSFSPLVLVTLNVTLFYLLLFVNVTLCQSNNNNNIINNNNGTLPSSIPLSSHITTTLKPRRSNLPSSLSNLHPPNSSIQPLIRIRSSPSSTLSLSNGNNNNSPRPPRRSTTLPVSNGSTLTPSSPLILSNPPTSPSPIASLIVTNAPTTTISTTVDAVTVDSVIINSPAVASIAADATATDDEDDGREEEVTTNVNNNDLNENTSASLMNVTSSTTLTSKSTDSMIENESKEKEKRTFTPSSPPSVPTTSSMSSGLNHGIFLNEQPHANGLGQWTGESSDRFLRAEMQRYDGWYNNLAHPDWGSIGTLK